MVKLKYFGDSSDHFKYSLITSLVTTCMIKRNTFEKYVFIPMLTNRSKQDELQEFINECKSLKHWREWLCEHVGLSQDAYYTDDTYFNDDNRKEYWEKFRVHLEKTLIFIDPDTGIERDSKIRAEDREKYITYEDLNNLIRAFKNTSALMIYQHLPRDKGNQDTALKKKIEKINEKFSDAFVCGCRKDEVSFVFVSKTKFLDEEIKDSLKNYSSNKPSVRIYCTPIKHPPTLYLSL